MVTSVNSSSLAALLAQQSAQANHNQAGGAAGSQAANTDSSQDPAVIYAGSNGAPSASAILSLLDGLNRAASISDVSLSAGQNISDLLSQVRATAAAAQATSDPDARAALDTQYQTLLQTIDKVAGSASFQGVNLLDGSSSGEVQFSAGLNGDSSLSLTPQNFTTSAMGLAGTGLTGSDDDLASLLGQVDAAGGTLAAQLAAMNAQGEQVQGQLGVVGQLQSSLAGGGADNLSVESAKLQALSVQQMLSGESYGVANQAPSALLSLFRSAS
jgi:flagellin